MSFGPVLIISVCPPCCIFCRLQLYILVSFFKEKKKNHDSSHRGDGGDHHSNASCMLNIVDVFNKITWNFPFFGNVRVGESYESLKRFNVMQWVVAWSSSWGLKLRQIKIDLMRLIPKAWLEASISTSTSQNFLFQKLGFWGLEVELELELGMFEHP